MKIRGATLPNRARRSGDANPGLARRPALDGADSVDCIQEELGVCLEIPIRTQELSDGTCNKTNKSSHSSSNIFWKKWSCEVDLVTIVVVSIVLIGYVIGSLTSSVETEKQLPHRY